VNLSGNNLLTHLYNSIRTEISFQRKKFEKWPPGELRAFARQHQEILDKIKKRDPQGARDLMQDHIMGGLQLTLDVEETKEGAPSKTL
jgi:DNA-binding FadR family transcriptional regulator